MAFSEISLRLPNLSSFGTTSQKRDSGSPDAAHLNANAAGSNTQMALVPVSTEVCNQFEHSEQIRSSPSISKTDDNKRFASLHSYVKECQITSPLDVATRSHSSLSVKHMTSQTIFHVFHEWSKKLLIYKIVQVLKTLFMQKYFCINLMVNNYMHN